MMVKKTTAQMIGQSIGNVKVPRGFRRKLVTTTGRFQNAVAFEALVLGNMCVHRAWYSSGWTITHTATGHAALGGKSFAVATKYARLLETAIDWSKVKVTAKGKLVGWTKPRKKVVVGILLPAEPLFAEKYPELCPTA